MLFRSITQESFKVIVDNKAKYARPSEPLFQYPYPLNVYVLNDELANGLDVDETSYTIISASESILTKIKTSEFANSTIIEFNVVGNEVRYSFSTPALLSI